MDVTCIWLDSSPYVVDASIEIGVFGQQGLFAFSSRLAVGQTIDGGMNVAGPDLPEQYGSTMYGCTFTAVDMDETTYSVWGQFSCDDIHPMDQSEVCAVGPSFFFFENCSPQ